MDSIRAIALGKAAGGQSITVEALSVTENGTVTAPGGKAYSPVSVSVPNSYGASDEGKVVSSGALVAQTSLSVNANGTVDTTLNNEVVVSVPQTVVEALSVTENGTYTAPGSKAYSPVTVNVSGGGDNILPDAYKEVEYIQTSGTQYVEIYYRVQVDDEITVTTMLTEQTTAERGFAGYCENHSPTNYYWELCYNEANLGYSSFPPGYNVPFRMVNISGNGKNISPNTKNTLVCKFATVSLLEKFYVGLYKTNAYNFTGRIYRFTIKRNGYKTLNLVPCYRVSDNVVGLFDLVRQAFYENAGSGSFGKGPDVA